MEGSQRQADGDSSCKNQASHGPRITLPHLSNSVVWRSGMRRATVLTGTDVGKQSWVDGTKTAYITNSEKTRQTSFTGAACLKPSQTSVDAHIRTVFYPGSRYPEPVSYRPFQETVVSLARLSCHLHEPRIETRISASLFFRTYPIFLKRINSYQARRDACCPVLPYKFLSRHAFSSCSLISCGFIVSKPIAGPHHEGNTRSQEYPEPERQLACILH